MTRDARVASIAGCLNDMCPSDAGANIAGEQWRAANHYAAAVLVNRLGALRSEAGANRQGDLAYLLAKEGRRIRNKYLVEAA